MIGETVNRRYRIEALIEKGFWGSVYQAAEIKSGQYALVKFIDYLADLSLKAIPGQLRAELKKAAALHSFGLLFIYRSGLHKACLTSFQLIQMGCF